MLPGLSTVSLLLSVGVRDAHHPAGSSPGGEVGAGEGWLGREGLFNMVHHSLRKSKVASACGRVQDLMVHLALPM